MVKMGSRKKSKPAIELGMVKAIISVSDSTTLGILT
jgi:hypothetical protein